MTAQDLYMMEQDQLGYVNDDDSFMQYFAKEEEWYNSLSPHDALGQTEDYEDHEYE